MVEVLQGKKMDFQSPGGLGTRQKAWGAELQEQEVQGVRP
jgi:hypothetical protein